MRMRWLAVIVIAVICSVAAILAWDAARIASEARPADVRAAYKLGIKAVVYRRDLDAVRAARPPATSNGGADRGNSFGWSRALLQRPSNCLTVPLGRPAEPDCEKAGTLTPTPERVVASRLPNGSHAIGVHAKPLAPGQMEAFGSIHGVEGEIGIGRDSRTASLFNIEIEGGLAREGGQAGAVSDDEPVEAGADCTAARIVRPSAPLIIASLPGVSTRQCAFTSNDRRSLVILQIQHGLLQRSPATGTLQCRALLKVVIDAARPPDFAGCLSGNWDDSEPPVAALVLFQSLGNGGWAVIR